MGVEDEMLILLLLILTSTLEPAVAQNNNAKTLKQLKRLVARLEALIQQAQDLVDAIQRTTAPNAATSTTNTFTGTTGIFVPPVGGYYKICAYSRFRNTGNSVDMCIRKSGTQVACYGNAIEHDWRTTGVCTIQTLTTTDTISLYLESGGANDCIEDTSL